MPFDAQDFRYDDSVECRAGAFHGFDFEAGGGEVSRNLTGVAIELDEVAKPIEGYSHGVASVELLEEAQIVLEERAQIVDAIAQHREPLDAHAERVAREFRRV